MAGSMVGVPNYYSLLSSPVKSTQTSGLSSFLYSASVTSKFGQNLSKVAQSQMSSYLSSVNSIASDLKTTAKPLISKDDTSIFKSKVVTSENKSIEGVAKSSAVKETFTINVKKLATAQSNKGDMQSTFAHTSFSEGINSISIKVGAKEKTVSLSVSAGETNKISLNKMAGAINSAKMGLTANVVSDSKLGTSFIKIISQKTGTENDFSIRDVIGNATDVSGANKREKESGNAAFSVNGKAYETQENTIELQDGTVKLSLYQVTNKDLVVSVNSDTEGITTKVENLISSYNKMMEFTNKNSGSFEGAQDLSKELKAVIEPVGDMLGKIGISVNNDGSLSYDREELKASIASKPSYVEGILTGKGGVAEKLASKVNDILSSPLSYAKPILSSQENAFGKQSGYSAMTVKDMYAGLLVDKLL